MIGERQHHYSVRRKTSRFSRDYIESNDRHGSWWAETKRMVDRGFIRFFERAGLRAPQVSESSCEAFFEYDPTAFQAMGLRKAKMELE